MQYFTTFFDKNYLSRGLVLIESLQKHSKDFELYLLCLDSVTFDYFEDNKSQYPEIKTLLLKSIEEDDSELVACKNNRTTIEYYFTLSPCLPLYVLKKFNLPHICSLDADIKFYDSPQVLFDYLDNYSIIITPHKFSKEVAHLEKFGKNNVSFQIFKNNELGLTCLEVWKKQCIDWCKDELDEINNRFADQKYLDEWENRYSKNLKILNDSISGLAPWNLNNYKITVKNKHFYSNNEKLVFYHFHHNKFFKERWATNGFHSYKVNYQKNLLNIYKNYWLNVNAYGKKINRTEENLIRTGNVENLWKILNSEKTVFLKINKFWIVYLNFRTLNPLIKKIVLKIYA